MSNDDRESNRLREAFEALHENATPRGHCPDPDAIWLAARGESSSEEVGRIVDHIAACPSCAGAWRLAMPDESRQSYQVELSPPRRLSGWMIVAGGLAAAALAWVALVSVGGVAPEPTPGPTLRAADDVVIRSLLDESASLDRDEALLKWEAGPEGSLYDVTVARPNLDPLTSAYDLSEPWFQIPPSALRGVPSGEKILWRVEALLPDGRHIASATFVASLE